MGAGLSRILTLFWRTCDIMKKCSGKMEDIKSNSTQLPFVECRHRRISIIASGCAIANIQKNMYFFIRKRTFDQWGL